MIEACFFLIEAKQICNKHYILNEFYSLGLVIAVQISNARRIVFALVDPELLAVAVGTLGLDETLLSTQVNHVTLKYDVGWFDATFVTTTAQVREVLFLGFLSKCFLSVINNVKSVRARSVLFALEGDLGLSITRVLVNARSSHATGVNTVRCFLTRFFVPTLRFFPQVVQLALCIVA